MKPAIAKISRVSLYIYAARAPTTNNELVEKRAQDSMSMVETVLYNPLIPARDPVVVRIFVQDEPDDNHQGEENIE